MIEPVDEPSITKDPTTTDWLAYHQMEFVFCDIFHANSVEARAKLRSRYKNFQKLGLPFNRKPGRGSKAPLTLLEVCELLLAFQLAEFDISPSVIKEVIATLVRSEIETSYRGSRPSKQNALRILAREVAWFYTFRGRLPADLYLVFEAKFLSTRWLSPTVASLSFSIVLSDTLNEQLPTLTGSYCLVNLSDLARRMTQQLKPKRDWEINIV